ncbi:MAG: extracellular solute-binding protein [Deinococcota bacterium]
MKKISCFILLLTLIATSSAQSFFADAAADLQGVTIRGVSESSPPSRYVAEVLAQQFEDETGIRVEFEATSWDQMYDKAIKDMEANTGIYDFVYIEQDIIYSYLARDFLVDVETALEANPDLRAPNVDFSDFTTFANNFRGENGNLYGVPMEAFIKVYLYRKDLFEDADIQAAFAEAYGYDLTPATSFAQYRDNAEFFTQYGEDNNLQLWGTTVQGSTGHPASTYEFLETIAPSFGLYDWGISDDFRASVENGGELNSDMAKEALAYWIDLLQFAPPEATSSTWDEVASSFAAGRAAQGWVYGENAAWIATDPDRSIVIGNVGVSLPPTAPGVIEDAEAGLGYIGYYDGGAFGIPYSSQNQEAALLFLQYIAQNEVQADWAVASARITHTATYDDAKVVEQDARVDGYYSLMREEGRLFKGAPEYPFHNPIRETIDPFIHRALTGELTASEALDQAAAAVDARLIELGFAE